MANFARATDDGILGWFRGASWTAKTTLYIALLTTNASDNAGTGLVEVVNGSGAGQWNGYARVAMTTATDWSAISGTTTRTISNANILNFGTASIASNGTITVVGYAIYDAATVGNLVDMGPLTASKVINDQDTVTMAVGALTVSVS